MIKIHEHSITITMIKNDYKSFDMNINNPTPTTYLHTYIFTYPPTHQHTYLPPPPTTYLATYLIPTYLPTHPLPYLPTSYLSSYNFSTTYIIVLYWYEINIWNFLKIDKNWTPFDIVIHWYGLGLSLWRV